MTRLAMPRILVGGGIFTLAAAIVFAQSNQVAAAADKVAPVKAGQSAPNADIVDLKGKATTVHKALNGKKTVLIFYRGGWCPFCNAHLGELAKVEGDLRAQGFQIMALSMDRPEELKKTIEKQKLPYTLYSDSKANAVKAFGLAFKVEDDLVKMYKEKYSIDMEAYSGETHHILPAPAVYLIDKDKKVRFMHFDPDYTKRLTAEEIVAQAKKI